MFVGSWGTPLWIRVFSAKPRAKRPVQSTHRDRSYLLAQTKNDQPTSDLQRTCLQLLLDLTKSETEARTAEDTLRADQCYHLRGAVLDRLAYADLSSLHDAASALEATDDPVIRAGILLKALGSD